MKVSQVVQRRRFSRSFSAHFNKPPLRFDF
jgi:hypothetical protein